MIANSFEFALLQLNKSENAKMANEKNTVNSYT